MPAPFAFVRLHSLTLIIVNLLSITNRQLQATGKSKGKQAGSLRPASVPASDSDSQLGPESTQPGVDDQLETAEPLSAGTPEALRSASATPLSTQRDTNLLDNEPDLKSPTDPTVTAESVLLDWMVEDGNIKRYRKNKTLARDITDLKSPTDPTVTESVLLDWMVEDGNMNRYRKNKKLARDIVARIEKEGIDMHGSKKDHKAVEHRIDRITKKYRDADKERQQGGF